MTPPRGVLPLPESFGWREGGLAVEGKSLSDLAERFGTPLYVTSEGRIRSNARRLRTAFRSRWPAHRVLYAVKANSNPAIVRLLRDEGCGADCSSPSEIRIARSAGVPATEILYTAAYPSEEELGGALDAGVAINLDDPDLLPRLLRIGHPTTLSFRLNPGRTDAGPEGLRFAGRGSKFGASLPRALKGYREARAAGITELGLHTMPGSNVLSAEHFGRVGAFLGKAVRAVRRVTGQTPRFADAGGGLGVPYRSTERPLDLDDAAARLTTALRREGEPTDGLELWNEPGRYLVADSTVLICRVTHVKEGSPPIVGTDAGMQTLLRPALYGAYHEIYPVAGYGKGPGRAVTLTGPICENTDILGRGRRLPSLAPGDLLAVGTAGAYGFSMASQYNTRPRPAEVLVGSRGARVIRTRETYDDLLRSVPAREMGVVAE
ncbi:MAG: diaminopimelate decarboxylase [Thermoplasmata archaeon]|nr:diaminopimelate decarboxylase [Thermoplasmata archaeon]